eukprot:1513382-Prymnesium_polylepis.1
MCVQFSSSYIREASTPPGNPVSRIAGWGPQARVHRVSGGVKFQIPNSRCSATPECGPRSRIQLLKRALRVRRVDQNTGSKFL